MRATMNRIAAVLLLCASATIAHAAGEVSVEAARHEEGVAVRARAVIDASYDTVWSTLTDYDRLGEFIPGMRSSRVLAREGEAATVEQTGEVEFLFVAIPIDVVVVSTARPPGSIDIRVLRGSLKRLDGGYRVEAEPSGMVTLRWEGIVEPAVPLPSFIKVPMMRANIENQFTGMVREIERREALRRQQSNEGSR